VEFRKLSFWKVRLGHLETWLKKGMHGKMHYMENHFEKRLNPALLVDGAKSVVSVLLNYFPKEDIFKNEKLKISKYAYGEDYHLVIKEKLSCINRFYKKLNWRLKYSIIYRFCTGIGKSMG
jgi:epoxyqueuosine reductase